MDRERPTGDEKVPTSKNNILYTKDQKQYAILPFWNHKHWLNSRRALKAISGCDWLTPMNFIQPLYKCTGCQKPATSRHLLFECNNTQICEIRDKILKQLGKKYTDDLGKITLDKLQKCLPHMCDNLQTINTKNTEVKILLKRIIFFGIGCQKLLIDFLKDMLLEIDHLQKTDPKLIDWNKLTRSKKLKDQTKTKSKWKQMKLCFDKIKILDWDQIAQGKKYFVKHIDGAEELQMIVDKKCEVNKQNRFVFLRLAERPSGAICYKFPSKFSSFYHRQCRNSLNTKSIRKKRKISQTDENKRPRKKLRPNQYRQSNERDPMEID